MYLHIDFHQNGKLLDSHHLITEALRSNPLVSITPLLDNVGCRCMKRLILCGDKVLNANDRRASVARNVAVNTTILA